MNPRKTVFWGLLLGLCPLFSFAQMRHYDTQNYMEQLALSDPLLSTNRLTLETATRQYTQSQTPQAATIPIVFHILYANATEQLSAEQIQSQLDALNGDFAMSTPIMEISNDPYNRYFKRAADTDIQFCYPTLDPLGNATTGIHYTPVTANLSDDLTHIKQADTGAAAWDTDRYLNIWICRLPDGVSGYAQMPGGAADTDGIVIDYRFFGTTGTVQSPYHLGHSLTHLVGNYLNLYPLWGLEKCGSDMVADTPIHNAPNTASSGALSPISNCVMYEHVSTCTGYPVEMTMNFMDNSGDACMYMFTQGQRMRMHATLNVAGGRNQLALQATNCTPSLQENDPEISYRTAPQQSSVDSDLDLLVFPNPVSDVMNIMVSQAFVTPSTLIEIHNTQGQLLYRSSAAISQPNFNINVSTWTAGIYFIQAKNEQHFLTRKFSIE